MLINTPCKMGDTVIMNGKKYTCGGFIIGASGNNVNLYDEKHKLFQPSFKQVEELERTDIFPAKWKVKGRYETQLELECPACGYERILKNTPFVPEHCERCGTRLAVKFNE